MTEMNDVPVGHAAIDSRVLAHRRYDNAVGQLEGADTKRTKQLAHTDSPYSWCNAAPQRCEPWLLGRRPSHARHRGRARSPREEKAWRKAGEKASSVRSTGTGMWMYESGCVGRGY